MLKYAKKGRDVMKQNLFNNMGLNYRKKKLDYLFYGISDNDFFKYLRYKKNIFSEDYLTTLHFYILTNPITKNARLRIYAFLHAFRSYLEALGTDNSEFLLFAIKQIISSLGQFEDKKTSLYLLRKVK